MKMDIYDLMYGLNEVSDYLVMETEKRSSQLKERVIIRWSTLAACVCLVVAAAVYSVYIKGGFGPVTPGDTVVGVTDDETDGAGETDDPHDTSEAYDTEKETNVITDESVLMVAGAFEKLSGASYYESEMTLYTLVHRGTSAAGQDRVLNYTLRRNPMGEVLFDLTYTDAYDTAYAESVNYQLYSPGGGDYVTRTSDRDGAASLARGKAYDFSTDTLMSILAADNDMSLILELSPLSYGQLKNYIAGAKNGTMTVYDGGVRVEFTLECDEVIDLIGLNLSSDERESAKGSAVFTFFISGSGYPESVSLSLELKTDDSTDELRLECSYADINQESGVYAPEWIDEEYNKNNASDLPTIDEAEQLIYEVDEFYSYVTGGIAHEQGSEPYKVGSALITDIETVSYDELFKRASNIFTESAAEKMILGTNYLFTANGRLYYANFGPQYVPFSLDESDMGFDFDLNVQVDAVGDSAVISFNYISIEAPYPEYYTVSRTSLRAVNESGTWRIDGGDYMDKMCEFGSQWKSELDSLIG